MLSADRYIAVCHPISAPKYRTPVIARCVSLTAWAASALLMVPVFMYAATLTRPDGGELSFSRKKCFQNLTSRKKTPNFCFHEIFFLQIFNLTLFSGQTCNIFWPDGKGNSENDINEEEDQNYLFSNATDTDYESSEGSRNFSPRAFTIYSLVLGFAIPLSLILIFYAQVVFKLRTVGELSLCVKQALISNSIKILFYLSL